MGKKRPTYRQSGVIAVRLRKGKKPRVLLITTRRRQIWTIPKGMVESRLSPRESAAKEAMEEAGVSGQTAPRSIGSYRYRKWGGTCEVEVFPMKVKKVRENWQEKSYRKRRWLKARAAASRLSSKKLSRLVRDLEDWIDDVDWDAK